MSDLEHAKSLAPEGINRKVDQYEINAVRRVSIGESLLGNRKKGLKIGIRAVKLAFMSESKRIDTSIPSLSSKGRLKAKSRALAGGVVALGINLLASPNYNIRRRAALRIASRSI
jgi:hypothetical protein